jgi:uncharacterized protein YlxW (UPF0749 family)
MNMLVQILGILLLTLAFSGNVLASDVGEKDLVMKVHKDLLDEEIEDLEDELEELEEELEDEEVEEQDKDKKEKEDKKGNMG